MSREINRILDIYSTSWFSSFSKLVSITEWGDRKKAEEYLNRYYISVKEYEEICSFKQSQIFNDSCYLPDLMYKTDFKILALSGGCLFVKNEFEQLQKVMQKIGDKYFFVIQHTQDYEQEAPMFRLKFPVNISWQDLIAGNFISAILFEMPYNNYFVFGDSCKWGKYAANDCEYPLDIFGFKQECASLFRENFVLSPKEQNEIYGWLPLLYKELIKQM